MLDGQTAIVSGAGRGIGQAIAHRLAADGAAVGLLARTATQVGSAAEEITAGGGRARAFPVDIRDGRSVRKAVQEIEVELGPITLLVNTPAPADRPATNGTSIPTAGGSASSR
jgi:3-oxoacyl-[acyl-carrier protein] reductase